MNIEYHHHPRPHPLTQESEDIIGKIRAEEKKRKGKGTMLQDLHVPDQ